MAPRYRNLIFDLDDTLIASFPQYAAMHQRIATELGLRVPSLDELADYRTTWTETLAHYWPDTSLEPFLARYEEVADEYVYPAIDGILAAMHTLREREHRLWIVTKRSSRRLSARMQAAGVEESLFEGIFPLEQQPVTKPDPRCFEPVWDALGGRAVEESLYVGDRREDMLAARAAGMNFLGVRSGPEQGKTFGADTPNTHILESAADVPDWLLSSHVLHNERPCPPLF